MYSVPLWYRGLGFRQSCLGFGCSVVEQGMWSRALGEEYQILFSQF